jgi:hypothetical protein
MQELAHLRTSISTNDDTVQKQNGLLLMKQCMRTWEWEASRLAVEVEVKENVGQPKEQRIDLERLEMRTVDLEEKEN